MPKQIFNSFKELQGLLADDKAVQETSKTPKNQKKYKTQPKVKNSSAKKPVKPEKIMNPIDPKLQAIFDALNWLKATFPNAFINPPGRVVPLKIGIGQDIADFLKANESDTKDTQKISLTLIRKALSMYTNNFRYLNASSIIGAARIDLQGNNAGEITAEQVEYAKKKLELLKERRKNKAAQLAATEETNVVHQQDH